MLLRYISLLLITIFGMLPSIGFSMIGTPVVATDASGKASGLTYAKARYYNPAIGRFYAPDPIAFRESDLTSINRYAYAANNPYKYVDPTGEFIWFIIPAIAIYTGTTIQYANAPSSNDNTLATTGIDELTDEAVRSHVPEKALLAYEIVSTVTSISKATKSAEQLGKSIANSSGATKEAKPPNLSPSSASRKGAFREAKRQSGVPVSQQPSRVLQNVDKRGKPQPGKIYEFEVPAKGGGTKTVRIRDDAGGHDFGAGNSQNRGSHFNDEAGNRFDY